MMPSPPNGRPPQIVILMGANGAGKSTLAPHLIANQLGLPIYVNADTIAHGLAAFDPEGVAFEAGRVMLTRLNRLAGARADFAFETTGATRSFAIWLERLARDGYETNVVYLWLTQVELAIARVSDRVRRGGHAVPPDIIRRRYARSLENFETLYRPLATRWRLYNTSSPERCPLIAYGSGHDSTTILDRASWNHYLVACRRNPSDRPAT